MRNARETPEVILRLVIATAAAGLLLACFAASVQAKDRGQAAATKAATPAPAAPAAPVIRDTRGNLQDCFQNETNAKARYTAAAAIADREGYPAVARLFRACAQSEQVHADQDVHAIAWMGNEAKAFMERPALGTTAENLQAAIERETYEATRLDPPFLARARAEHQAAAVRSLTYALATEREHAKLFTEALASLDRKPAPHPIWVCGVCGNTVSSLDFSSCPNCFAPVRKFSRVD